MERFAETHVQVEVRHMRTWQIGGAIALAAAAFGCSGGDPVSIGNDEKTGESLSDYGAAWDGYIEGTTFRSGSDRVRLVLDTAGNGYLQLGDMPLLDPPTDPNVPYPNDPNYPTYVTFGSPESILHEGFRYTVKNATVEQKRIRLSVATWEFYKQWCELQTSYPNPDPNGVPPYSCTPLYHDGIAVRQDDKCYSGSSDDLPPPNPTQFPPVYDVSSLHEVPCVQPDYCLIAGDAPCACSAGGCTSTDNTQLTIDAALDQGGNELTGTLVFRDNATVRLSRH
jgi:hypothetical protein